MDNNQMSSANHIIEHLNAINVDGEMMQYIIDNVGMSNQMLKQLTMLASDLDINNILEERNAIHDVGNNNHLLPNNNELKTLKDNDLHDLLLLIDTISSELKYQHHVSKYLPSSAINQIMELYNHVSNEIDVRGLENE